MADNWKLDEVNLKGWDSFLMRVARPMRPRIFARHPVLYRGQSDHRWGLQTTLERGYESGDVSTALKNTFLSYYRSAITAKPAIESLAEGSFAQGLRALPEYTEMESLLKKDPFRWLDSFLRDKEELHAFFIYLRHHGYPSPLLDWSASPFVAAFFAFDSLPRSEYVSVFVLEEVPQSGSSERHFFFLGPNVRTHPRHFRQQSGYTLCVANTDEDYAFIEHQDAEAKIRKLNIPSADRVKALAALDQMNINRFSLFGSEDALVQTIARRECLFRPAESDRALKRSIAAMLKHLRGAKPRS